MNEELNAFLEEWCKTGGGSRVMGIDIMYKKIESALKLQELLKGDKIINLKSLIRSITNCTSASDEMHARRYEEEIFAFLDEIQTTLKETSKECPKCKSLCTDWGTRWVCDACGYGKVSGEEIL